MTPKQDGDKTANHASSQESDGLDLFFHTNTESGKTHDLQSDSHVNISFLTPSSGAWASISGTASLITDRSVTQKYYTPTLKTWLGDLGDGVHDGGENDPRFGVIKFKTITATYAVPKGTILGRGIEIVKSATTGEAPKVTELREISEEEVKSWRAKS